MENSTNFKQKLASLATEDSTADFTISCSGHDFHVHRTIVRLHSGWFARLFKSEWQSNKDSRVELNDDPLSAVHAMVDFFYRFRYGASSYEEGKNVLGEAMRSGFSQGDGLCANVQFHAWMWTLADKYDIPDLKLLACENFSTDSVKLFHPVRFMSPYPAPNRGASINVDTEQELVNAKEAWFKAVDYIYENSNPTEKGLGISVVKVWQSVAAGVKIKVGKKPWEELVAKFPKLGVEMIMELDHKGVDKVPREVESMCLPTRSRNIFNRQNELARLKYASSDDDDE